MEMGSSLILEVAMAKKSAGILMFRRRHGILEVFLVHPGGPFWAKKDRGAWSVPKGEYEVDENSFEQITGAKKDFYRVPLIALRELERLGVKAWPALMGDLFSREDISKFERFLRKNGIQSELELEYLEAYPFVLANMKKRNIE